MSEQDELNQTPSASPASENRAPYHRHHISQEPIDDVEPDYVMPNRYTTVDQATSQRKHMGVASNDPDYLPRTGPKVNPRPSEPPRQAAGQKKGTLNYDRYLEMPKSGKSIFTSRQRRRQKRIHQAIGVAVAAAVVILIIVLFVL